MHLYGDVPKLSFYLNFWSSCVCTGTQCMLIQGDLWLYWNNWFFCYFQLFLFSKFDYWSWIVENLYYQTFTCKHMFRHFRYNGYQVVFWSLKLLHHRWWGKHNRCPKSCGQSLNYDTHKIQSIKQLFSSFIKIPINVD